MKYKIGKDVASLKSAKGNEYKKFNIKSSDGVVTENVVAFSSFTQYAQTIPGAEIEAVLQEKDYNGQKSYSLVDGNLGSKPNSFGGGAKMVAEKAKNIEKAQERKAEAIEVSATARDATLILVALMSKGDVSDWKDEWLKTRYWLVKNWNNIEQPKINGTAVDYPQDDINVDDIPF